ncbi:LPXTG cell wall anchor domain-containing protein [Staphylococcus epidermidis]|uniref:LPXTG cell wall anchor domain-containing protein n=2 Tax=Staphylococcus epidermidis TaxID=1282 RepID=UPI0013713FE1|nr:LPXTG cell wall anchor domain-containing protein [Staphylococcus epidermidis]MCG1318978.1 LPXTG cell wall anchor domain-containing protein [Staphylococcus epidermidis]MCG1321221.1 LPXTG cell wall anchor domain-containing protein [Staphylococcus epidermidis]MCG1559461.1 LPXTG cell wall anchor domain-containing protein [Staphylococcus epidermidis]NAM22224.1 LPXTG cell wall anchor domain-containing protein [Staphylococcus epidermidis]
MKRTDKIGVYLKLSCSALLLSGSLVGYGFTKDAFADSESTSSNVENTSNSNSIADKIQQAKNDIKDLKELSDADIKSFEERLDKVDNQSSIDRIINDAKDKNNHLESTDSSATSSKTEDDDTSEKDNDDITKDLDKILSDLDSIAKNVDNHQQDEGSVSKPSDSTTDEEDDSNNKVHDTSASTRNATTDDSEASVIDKLDKIQQDFKSDSNNKPSEQSNQQASPSNKTENNKEESSTTTNQSDSDSKDDKSNDGRRSTLERLASDTDQIRDSKNQHVTDGKQDIQAITRSLQGSDKIEKALAKVQTDNQSLDSNYINNKLMNLRALDTKVEDNNTLSDDKKQALKQEIDKTKQSIDRQRNIIIDQLNGASNKKQATEDILNSVFSKNEVEDIMKRIKTNGRSNEDIANQIAKQIDGLALTSSDDILKSMLDQSKDKESLIKQLLTTRLGNDEADRIAKKLLSQNLSNSQIVEQLKRHFNSQGTATADDILNGVINDAKDKRQAIETILQTRFNKDKAKIIADVIARVQKDKSDIMNFIHSAIEGKANDLLDLEKRAKQAKKDLEYILDPIKNRPSLLDRINKGVGDSNSIFDRSSLLDKLHSRGSILDKLDHSAPENGLSLDNKGGLLSDLFDDDGNISLPATGEVIKQHWMPMAVVLMSLGGALIFMARRKKHQN